jgi:hypothetical protein
MARGQLDEAIACYGTAIELDPKFARARTQLATAQRLAAARDKLPGFQDESYTPVSNEERLGLAEWCRIQKLLGNSTRLYAEAFAADPTLADDLEAAHRCNAARAAARPGQDTGNRGEQERTRLRKQAVDWRRADLALRTKQLDSRTPADRAKASTAMSHWQQDPDLAGIRNPRPWRSSARLSERSVRRSGQRCRRSSTAPGGRSLEGAADRLFALVNVLVESGRSDLDSTAVPSLNAPPFARYIQAWGVRFGPSL